jgi:hypothetical protein
LILSPARPDVAFRAPRRRCRFAPLLQQKGATTAGKTRSTTTRPPGSAARARKGCSKSKLMLEVRPENGSPTPQAEMVISLTSTEKARKMFEDG